MSMSIEHYRLHDDDDDVDNVCKYVYSVPAILYSKDLFMETLLFCKYIHTHIYALTNTFISHFSSHLVHKTETYFRARRG